MSVQIELKNRSSSASIIHIYHIKYFLLSFSRLVNSVHVGSCIQYVWLYCSSLTTNAQGVVLIFVLPQLGKKHLLLRHQFGVDSLHFVEAGLKLSIFSLKVGCPQSNLVLL